MKKICLWTLVLLTLFLTACGTNPLLTLPEMETAYEQSLQTTLDTFQSYFAPIVGLPWEGGMSEGQGGLVQTNLALTFPKSSNLQGEITYTSTKHSQSSQTTQQGVATPWTATEKANHTFNMSLENTASATPILASGSIDTLYTDNLMHFNIQNFNLFMGEGNAEINFINLLAQQLAHKRVALDKNESIGISIIETPDVSELLAQLSDFLTAKNLTYTCEDTALPCPTEYTVSEVNATHLASVQSLYTLLANLFDLPLPATDFTLDTTQINQIYYTTDHEEVVMNRTLNYATPEQTLIIETLSSPTTLRIVIVPQNRETPEQEPEDLVITIHQQAKNTYTLDIGKYLGKEIKFEISAKINLKKADNQTTLTFQGTADLSSFQLTDNEQLQIKFEGTQMLSPSTETDFSLSGTLIKLSDLL